jgi:hypothetical protein
MSSQAPDLRTIQEPLKQRYRDVHGIATLLRLTERYCVVLQTIRSAPPVTIG